MSNDYMPKCPFCGSITKFGERDSFSLSFGETPLVCSTHGEVGYRDHDYGDYVLYRRVRAENIQYWGA